MEALPGLWSLAPIPALLGFIALMGWMLATGRLYTKSQHDEIVALHDNRAEIQSKTIDRHERTIDSQNEQIKELLVIGGVTADFFQRADAIRSGGDDRAAPQAV